MGRIDAQRTAAAVLQDMAMGAGLFYWTQPCRRGAISQHGHVHDYTRPRSHRVTKAFVKNPISVIPVHSEGLGPKQGPETATCRRSSNHAQTLDETNLYVELSRHFDGMHMQAEAWHHVSA